MLFFTVRNVSSQKPEQGAAFLTVTGGRRARHMLSSRGICLNKMSVSGGVGVEYFPCALFFTVRNVSSQGPGGEAADNTVTGGGGWMPFQMEGEPSMVLPACPGESVTVLFGDLAPRSTLVWAPSSPSSKSWYVSSPSSGSVSKAC